MVYCMYPDFLDVPSLGLMQELSTVPAALPEQDTDFMEPSSPRSEPRFLSRGSARLTSDNLLATVLADLWSCVVLCT